MKVRHPEFSYRGEGGAAPIIFVFDRAIWKEPIKEQLAEYDRNREIVERHGGMMIRRRHEAAGRNPRFSRAEVDAAILAVKRANPRLDVYTHWNGVGCYSLSVGARTKAKRRTAIRRRADRSQQ